MLNKFLNNKLNNNSRLLSEAKEKVEQAARKKVDNILGDNIPNPQDLQSQLKNKLSNPTQEQLLEAERIYNRFLNLINIAISKLEAKKGELESIKNKLDSILNNLQAFRDFVDFLSPVIKGLKLAIPTIDGVLASSVALAASGTVISNATLKKKDVKDSLKKADEAIESFEDPANYFVSEVDKIKAPLDRAIEKVDSLINFLLGIKAQLEAIYIKYLNDVGLLPSNEENEESGNESPTEEDLNNNPDLTTDIISTTITQNNKKSYIIKNNGAVVEYGIGDIPTNEFTSVDSGR